MEANFLHHFRINFRESYGNSYHSVDQHIVNELFLKGYEVKQNANTSVCKPAITCFLSTSGFWGKKNKKKEKKLFSIVEL